MSGNRYVAGFPGLGRAYYVSNSSVQTQVIGSFQDRNFNINLGYAKNGDCRTKVLHQAILVTLDAALGPQSEVRTYGGTCDPVRRARRSPLPSLEPPQFRTGQN